MKQITDYIVEKAQFLVKKHVTDNSAQIDESGDAFEDIKNCILGCFGVNEKDFKPSIKFDCLICDVNHKSFRPSYDSLMFTLGKIKDVYPDDNIRIKEYKTKDQFKVYINENDLVAWYWHFSSNADIRIAKDKNTPIGKK